MKSLSLSQASKLLSHPFPIWIRWSSITTLVSSVGLFGISLFAYNYYAFFAVSLLPSLLVALSFAIFLNFYSLWHLRREHRKTDRAFRDTDCEFSSVFQNVLDGILILDNEADCLDANPAAAAILRLPIKRLIGENVGRFLVERNIFGERWNSFLQYKNQRVSAQLVAG